MKTLKEIIQVADVDKIMENIKKYYPNDPKENIIGYRALHEEFLEKEPTPCEDGTDMMITLKVILKVCDDCTAEFAKKYTCEECPFNTPDPKEEEVSYYNVSGIDLKDLEGVKYGLNLCLFSEWLGYKVDQEAIEKYSAETFLAHVYWEMTFHGWSDENIKEFRDTLNDQVEKIDKSLEEGSDDFIDFEDVIKECGIDKEAFEKKQKELTEKMIEKAEKLKNR